ncbi:MAG: putative S-layer protein [Nanoarchaeota archaeon]
MKTKSLSLIGLSVVLSLVFISLASATISFTDVTGNSQTVKDGTSATISFKVHESGQDNLTNITFNAPLTLTSGSNSIVSQSTVTGAITSLTQNTTSGVMSITFNVPIGKNSGTYTGNLVLSGFYGNATYTNSLPLTVIVNKELNFCKYSDNGNLDITIEDITVKNGFGSDNEWYPFDEVEVEVLVENNGNEDIKDIVVEWGLYDLDKGSFYKDGEENDFNLNDGDDKTILINLNLDKKITNLKGNNFKVYVWATGEDKEFDSNRTCLQDFESPEIIIDDDFVVLDNIQALEVASCGSSLPITADIWNIGDDDQNDVSVRIINTALGINKDILIGDIDTFEKDRLDITVDLPAKADEKTYVLSLSVLNEDKDLYENSDNDESRTTLSFKLEGNCKEEANKVLISAALESGGNAGEELVVRTTVKNTGTKTASYILNVIKFTSWASSADIDQKQLTLSPGESKDVLMTFNVNKDASGEKSFEIETLSDNKLLVSQPVAVTIEESKSGVFSTGIINKDNWYLWGIGLINLVLIVIIIMVALRVARR